MPVCSDSGTPANVKQGGYAFLIPTWNDYHTNKFNALPASGGEKRRPLHRLVGKPLMTHN